MRIHIEYVMKDACKKPYQPDFYFRSNEIVPGKFHDLTHLAKQRQFCLASHKPMSKYQYVTDKRRDCAQIDTTPLIVPFNSICWEEKRARERERAKKMCIFMCCMLRTVDPNGERIRNYTCVWVANNAHNLCDSSERCCELIACVFVIRCATAM